jgi:hypothetical protein
MDCRSFAALRMTLHFTEKALLWLIVVDHDAARWSRDSLVRESAEGFHHCFG